MSIQKIARIAGVSVATVSRVINHSPSVKANNREKVLQAIKSCNYQPNLLARQLRTARSYMLLVLVSDIANPFCAAIVKGIEQQAERRGYRILLCNSGSDSERQRSSLSLLAGKTVDGVISMDAFVTLPELSKFIGNTPWVQCAEYADKGPQSSVGIDDVLAARQVVQHLADEGRTRIALINHDLDYRYAQLREQGYRAELSQQKLIWQAVGYADELSFNAGKRAMQKLLQADTKPDAIFAVSDMLAAGAMATIQAKRMRVPEDIAVVGFDGTELGEMVTPPLTTVRQPSIEIGREAVNLLLSKIENSEILAKHIIMEAKLVIRLSSKTV